MYALRMHSHGFRLETFSAQNQNIRQALRFLVLGLPSIVSEADWLLTLLERVTVRVSYHSFMYCASVSPSIRLVSNCNLESIQSVRSK